MINISKDDLSQYQKLGSGKYGTVYQVNDDIAYKIYHTYILDNKGHEIINPALFTPTYKIKSLLKRNDNIIYSDLIEDIIIVDGFFGGVVIPYYEGSPLEKLTDIPYQVKRDISKQLVRNHKELRRNLIFPMDYHLGNIIYDNGEAKIIDLDDPLTRVDYLPDLFAILISTGRLNETIQDLFQESKLYYLSKDVNELVNRNRSKYSNKINWLSSYLEEKEKIQDYLLVDEFTSLKVIKDLISDKEYRIILIIDQDMHSEEFIINKILELKRNNIPIYDIINPKDIDSYFNNYPSKEKILIKDNYSHILTN